MSFQQSRMVFARAGLEMLKPTYQGLVDDVEGREAVICGVRDELIRLRGGNMSDLTDGDRRTITLLESDPLLAVEIYRKLRSTET